MLDVYQVFVVKNQNNYNLVFAESKQVFYLEFIRDNIEYEDVIESMGDWNKIYTVNTEDEIEKCCTEYMLENNITSLLSFMYKDFTWYGGTINLNSNIGNLYHEKRSLANFHGFKLSSKSPHKRKETTIFKKIRKLPVELHQRIIDNGYIGDPNSWDIWGKSIDTPILKEVVKYFNSLNLAKHPASYFYIYDYDKKLKLFSSLDREVPCFGEDDNFQFNENNCLMFDNYIFEFYRESKTDSRFNAFEASVTDDDHYEVTNIGEKYDFAYYTIRCLNNYISNHKQGKDICNFY